MTQPSLPTGPASGDDRQDWLRPPPPKQPYGAPPGQQGSPSQPGSPSRQPGQQEPPPPKQPYSAQPPPGFPPAPPAGYLGYRPAALPIATLGARLLAVLIDGIIVAAATVLCALPLVLRFFRHVLDQARAAVAAAEAGTSAPRLSPYDPTSLRLAAGIVLVGTVVSFAYHVPQLARFGRTLGKRVCQLRVVRGTGPRELGFAAAAARWAVQFLVPNVVPLGFLLGFLDSLWCVWDQPNRQCLHDKVARTVVVRSG